MNQTKTPLGPEFAECWQRAQAHWSRFLLLSEPLDDPELPAIAQIDLGSRQVSVCLSLLQKKQLLPCMEAILAHEVGHHVRYPGSLLNQARLRLLERGLLPYEHYSLLNLFTDLLINHRLGATLHAQLQQVYRSFRDDLPGQRDPAFLFYLGIYEALWRLEQGTLIGPQVEAFGQQFPHYRADAQLVVQNLFHLGPNLFTQFLYFLSVMCRYIELPEEREAAASRALLVPCDCDGGEPSPEDWAEALTPSAREREAIERAMSEGWIQEAEGARLGELRRRILGLPGQGTADAGQVPEIMAAYYRREAEKYLFRPPPQPSYGEAVVPTTLEAWEPGEPTQRIDWLATLQRHGPELAVAMAQKRLQIPEREGYDAPTWRPRVEIYLDVSGSMPNPIHQRNAMTLAAQILTMATVRAGGWVRALLYSTSHVAYWEWCRSETEISRFLMHFIGAGTSFPFAILEESVRQCKERQPIRVIISDHDFARNLHQDDAHPSIFAQACKASESMVLLLHLFEADDAIEGYRRHGAQVLRIEELTDFPTMAAALSKALLAERS